MESLMPWYTFDGKLFHIKYLAAENGSTLEQLCDNKVGFSFVCNYFYNLISLILYEHLMKEFVFVSQQNSVEARFLNEKKTNSVTDFIYEFLATNQLETCPTIFLRLLVNTSRKRKL